MDILSKGFDAFVGWLGAMTAHDYTFWFRMVALYVSTCLCMAFGFLVLELRSEPIQCAVALVAGMASFSIPVVEPSHELAKTYTLVLGSIVLLGAAGIGPFFMFEAQQRQRRARRLSYAIIVILVLLHLCTRRYFQ